MESRHSWTTPHYINSLIRMNRDADAILVNSCIDVGLKFRDGVAATERLGGDYCADCALLFSGIGALVAAEAHWRA